MSTQKSDYYELQSIISGHMEIAQRATYVNSMLESEQLPARISYLYTRLANVDWNALSHSQSTRQPASQAQRSGFGH